MTLKRGCAFGLLLILAASGCHNRIERKIDFIAKADRFFANGDIPRAVLEYKSALQLDPKDINVRFSLGRCYIAQKRLLEGYKQLNAALEIDPDFRSARLELAALLNKANQPQMALDQLALLKENKEYEPRYRLIGAESQFMLGKAEDALALLQSIDEKDRDKEALCLLTFCLSALKEYRRMEETAYRWQRVDPSDTTSYILMARYFHWIGEKGRVMNHLDEMVKHNPESLALRGRMLEDLGMLEEARSAIISLPDTPEFLKEKAGFFLRQGRIQDAEEILRQITTDRPKDIDAVIDLSRLLCSRNDVPASALLLDKTLSLELKDEDKECILLEKASLLATQGKLMEAKQICEEVLEANQGNMDARLLLGKALFNLGNIGQAELQLNQVVKARPEMADAHILVSRCQMHNKKESLAEETLWSFLKLQPHNLPVRMELADLYTHLQDFDKAVKVLEEGLALNPDETSLLTRLGRVRMEQKKYKEAEEDFSRIIRTHTSEPSGYMEMGRLMYIQSRFDQAEVWFKRAIQKNGVLSLVLPALLETYRAKGQIESMATLISAQLKDTPHDPTLHYFLGITYFEQEEWARCTEELLTAKRLAPEWISPYIMLAKMYLKQGRLDNAIDEYKQGYEKVPSMDIGLQLAALYELSEKWKEGISIYQDMLERFGEFPKLLNNLAFFYAEYCPDEVKLESASQMVTKALSFKPESLTYLDTAAWVAYKQERLDIARDYIKKALAISPDDGVCNLHAALILHESGEELKALEHLEKASKDQLDPRSRQKVVVLKRKWAERKITFNKSEE